MEETQQEENIVSGLYDGYNDTQKEILEIEIRKTRNKLFTLAAIIFVSDLLGLAMVNAVNATSLLIIAVVPVVYIGLAFLALKEPLLAMIVAAIIILAIWIYTISRLGGAAAISGWLVKAIVVYMMIAGFQNAKEAQRIKKELRI
jgi:hypothetical protein